MSGVPTVTHEYKGQSYTRRQLSQLPEARAVGLTARQIQSRLSNGWDVEEAVTAAPGQARQGHSPGRPPLIVHSYKGESFTRRQLAELPEARAVGVTERQIQFRLAKGWSVEDAITTAHGRVRRGHDPGRPPRTEPVAPPRAVAAPVGARETPRPAPTRTELADARIAAAIVALRELVIVRAA